MRFEFVDLFIVKAGPQGDYLNAGLSDVVGEGVDETVLIVNEEHANFVHASGRRDGGRVRFICVAGDGLDKG